MSDEPFQLDCPVPFSDYERVTLAHGGGGRVMHRLIERLFCQCFANDLLAQMHDGTRLSLTGPLAVTTDAFTVSPLFFPGGDIGSLAVHGTINDLAMCGARPRHLTVCFVLEEGFPLRDLERVVRSLADAAQAENVTVVAGDTKVVERGKGDGVFVAVTGLGEVIAGSDVAPRRIAPGDAVLVSGPVGDHGTAVMLAREGLPLPDGLVSDAASVVAPVLALLNAEIDAHCLRDVTRGGLATVLNELASSAGVAMHVDERSIAVRDEVSDACELLGLDPLYVACEGRFVAVVPEREAERALSILRAHPVSAGAQRIGEVREARSARVVLRTSIGSDRVLDLLSGEQLPRIC
jgi:hydrogenase expression/formation protein HypE